MKLNCFLLLLLFINQFIELEASQNTEDIKHDILTQTNSLFELHECITAHSITSIAETLTKWIVNGFSSVNVNKNKNALIYGKCLAGFFGDSNYNCNFKHVTKPSPALSKCTHALNNFSRLVGPHSGPSIINLLSEIIVDFHEAGLVEMKKICENLPEVFKHRVLASEGGHFNKSKMTTFCKKKPERCAGVRKFLADKKKYLQHVLEFASTTVTDIEPPDVASSEKTIVGQVADAILANIYVYNIDHVEWKYTDDDQKWAHDTLNSCAQQFFNHLKKLA